MATATTTGGMDNRSPMIPSPTSAAVGGQTTVNSLMLNLTGLFSGSSSSSIPKSASSGSNVSTAGTPAVADGTSMTQPPQSQPGVEARLWNADQPQVMSPPLLSPAGPRYIPAVAGSNRFGGAAVGGASSMRMNGGGPTSPTMMTSRGGTRPLNGFGQQRQQQQQQQNDIYQPGTATHQSISAMPSIIANGSTSPGLPRSNMTAVAHQGSSPAERIQESTLSGSSSYLTTSTTTTTTRTTRQKKQLSGQETNGSMGGMMALGSSGYANTSQSKRWDDYRGSDDEEENDFEQNRRHERDDDRSHESRYKEGQDRLYNRRRSKRGGLYNNNNGYLNRLGDLFESKTGKAPPLLLRDPKRVLRTQLFCLRKNRRLHPAVRLILIVFLAGSVCFTTWHLLFVEDQSRTRVTIGKGIGHVKDKGQKFKALLSKGKIGPAAAAGLGSEVEGVPAGNETEEEGDLAFGKKKVISVFDVEALNYSSHQWNLETYDINYCK